MARRKDKDLKYLFIRGLLEWEIYQRKHHYLKSAAEWTSKAIVSLDLEEGPIRSVKQASQLDGVGKEICKKLKEFQTGILLSRECPLPGQFVSSAPAFLLAMLLNKEQCIRQSVSRAPDKCYITEEELKPLAATMCKEKFDVVNSDVDVFCPALWRLNVLCSRELVKKWSVGKKPAYELLPSGQEIAVRLKAQRYRANEDVAQGGAASCSKEEVMNQRGAPADADVPSNPSSGSGHKKHKEFLYSNDNGKDESLLLVIDTHEWGGDRVGLSQLVGLVKRTGMKYRTEQLKCGDYSWVRRWGQQEVTLPFLVERKRADDLARSLRDGRYSNQKSKMLKWKTSFTDAGIDCQLVYLIEGRPEQYAVKCADGCGAVIKCGYPTVQQLKAKIKEIDEDSDFELIETESIHATVEYLQLVYAELMDRTERGDFSQLKILDINPNENVQRVEKRNNNTTEDNLNKLTDRHGGLKTDRKSASWYKQEAVVILDPSQETQDALPALLTLKPKIRTKQANPASTTTRTPKTTECRHSREPDIVIDDDSEFPNTESQEMVNAPLEQYHSSPHIKKSAVKLDPYDLGKEDFQEIDMSKGTIPVRRARNNTSNKDPGTKKMQVNCPQKSSNQIQYVASPVLKMKFGPENIEQDATTYNKTDPDMTEIVRNKGKRKTCVDNKMGAWVDNQRINVLDGNIHSKSSPSKSPCPRELKARKNVNYANKRGLTVGQQEQIETSNRGNVPERTRVVLGPRDYMKNKASSPATTNSIRPGSSWYRSFDLQALNNRRRLNFEATSSYGEFNVGESLKVQNSLSSSPLKWDLSQDDKDCDLLIVEKKLCNADVSKPGVYKSRATSASPGISEKGGQISVENTLNTQSDMSSKDSCSVETEELLEKIIASSDDEEDKEGMQSTQECEDSRKGTSQRKRGLGKYKSQPNDSSERNSASSGIKIRSESSVGLLKHGASSDDEFYTPALKIPRLDVNASTSRRVSGHSSTDIIIDLDKKSPKKVRHEKVNTNGNDDGVINSCNQESQEASDTDKTTVKHKKELGRKRTTNNPKTAGKKERKGRKKKALESEDNGQGRGKGSKREGTTKGKRGGKSGRGRGRKVLYDFIVSDESETEVSGEGYVEESESGGSIDLFDEKAWAVDDQYHDPHGKTKRVLGKYKSQTNDSNDRNSGYSGIKRLGESSAGLLKHGASSEDEFDTPALKVPRLDVNASTSRKGSEHSCTDIIIDLDKESPKEVRHEKVNTNSNDDGVMNSCNQESQKASDTDKTAVKHNKEPGRKRTTNNPKTAGKKERKGRKKKASESEDKGQGRSKGSKREGTTKGKRGGKSGRGRGRRVLYDFIVSDESETEVSSEGYVEESESGGSIDLFDEKAWAVDDQYHDPHGKTKSERCDIDDDDDDDDELGVLGPAVASTSGSVDNSGARNSRFRSRNKGRGKVDARSIDVEETNGIIIADGAEDEKEDLPNLVLEGPRKVSRSKSYSAQLKEIELVLPDYDYDNAICLLNMYNGNVEMTVAAMLEDV